MYMSKGFIVALMKTLSSNLDMNQLHSELVRIRRTLHAYPELAFQEHKTAAFIQSELETVGMKGRYGIAETGMIFDIVGDHPGKNILFRADMDALPIQEQNETDYRSTVSGVMHACGHDGHSAIGILLAKILHERRSDLKGSVRVLFQPAEEDPGGALPMIEANVLKDRVFDAALAFHLDNYNEVGTVGVVPGPIMACKDVFKIALHGKGGHGAHPHRSNDTVLAAARVVEALQGIVSRVINPVSPAVISVCRIEGGTTNNVLPPKTVIEGAARVFDEELRSTLPERIERVITGVAKSLGCTTALDYKFGYPPLVNDPGVTASVESAVEFVLGDDAVNRSKRSLGADDMSYFLDKIPGCYAFLGSRSEERGFTYPHHHPNFDFDERALSIGLQVALETIERLNQGE